MQPGGRKLAVIVAVGAAVFACRATPVGEGIGTILFVGREAMPPDECNWGVHMCDQFFGFHATQKLMTRGDGLYVLENPFLVDTPSGDMREVVGGESASTVVSYVGGLTVVFR